MKVQKELNNNQNIYSEKIFSSLIKRLDNMQKESKQWIGMNDRFKTVKRIKKEQ